MKITNIETICLSRMHEIENQWKTFNVKTLKADVAIVVVSTDSDIIGIGEACAYGNPTFIKIWIDKFAPEIIGKDPREIEFLPHPVGFTMEHFNKKNDDFLRGHDSAVGGLDCAIWDLKAKINNTSVSKLISPKSKDSMKVYASSGVRYDWREDPNQLIEETKSYIDLGFSATKVRIGTKWTWDNVTTDKFIGLMRDLSSEVGKKMNLMVDGNCNLNIEQATKIAKELEKLNFLWFEEPINKDDIEGYIQLNASVDMPISGGEQLTTLAQFVPYIDKRAYDIVQPDVGEAGITECLRISKYAENNGIKVIPHSWHNGLMVVASAHFASSLSNPQFVEMCMVQGPLQWDILKEYPIKSGVISIEGPGLGVNLAENLTKKFPYIEGNYFVDVVR
ncbi:MAG: mandelate racemase/muconate lactonizing enzyme family protein [SAR202 cluster bacterium]|nr:mandelate racemase/muconate lactonizing enzyme family protein [SAR202 cluster bacterium]|tara:strand:+ start:92967 stop:94142 length:1176 start_codon:yes stop_codon:yes gene_type:complete